MSRVMGYGLAGGIGVLCVLLVQGLLRDDGPTGPSTEAAREGSVSYGNDRDPLGDPALPVGADRGDVLEGGRASGGENVRSAAELAGSRVVRTEGSPGELRYAGDPAAGASALPPPRARFSGTASGGVAGTEGGLSTAAALEREVVLSAATLRDAVETANAALANGEKERAVRLLRGVFVKGRSIEDLDLVVAVEQLLDLEKDPLRRREYVDYLVARRATAQAVSRQVAYAKELQAAGEALEVRQSWSELSRAYEIAASAEERRVVLDELETLLEAGVFSGRFSPLVERYTVKPGDALSRIAARYQTTSDALRRLNRLSTDTIQPRMQLRVLPGKPAIFVDKSDFRLWLAVDGKVLLHRRVALGRNNSTPAGRFVIETRQKDPVWYRLGEAPIAAGDPRNVLGTRWLGFKDTDEHAGLGIHGTDDPASIGTECSSGCIRLLTSDVELLYDFVPRGTVVTVRD